MPSHWILAISFFGSRKTLKTNTLQNESHRLNLLIIVLDNIQQHLGAPFYLFVRYESFLFCPIHASPRSFEIIFLMQKGHPRFKLPRKGSFHWYVAWNIVFLDKSVQYVAHSFCLFTPLLRKVFSFSRPLWDKVFTISHHFSDKVFAFSHSFWDKVFPFHTPKNCTWKNEKWSPYNYKNKTVLSLIGCAADS